jgi:hypothetical protein
MAWCLFKHRDNPLPLRQKINAHKILCGAPEGQGPLGSTGHREEGNVKKWIFKNIGSGAVE